MNPDQWIRQVEEAYQWVGATLSPNKRALLLADLPENPNQALKEVVAEASDIMSRYFFKKVSQGETFGSLTRIREAFGMSLEENYGLSSGPFINMAKTYWTYKLEVGDLFPKYHRLALSQILLKMENDFASIFFPTPGPMKIPVSQRREAQREVLREYAPVVDIERFLSESPILRAEANKGGCLGMIALMTLPPLSFLIVLWFLFR